MKARALCWAFMGLLTLAGCGGKRTQKAEPLQTLQAEDLSVKEQIEGWVLIRRLQKAYGLLGDWVNDPDCPAFLMGAYLEEGRLVIQVEGDTLLIRQELEHKIGSGAFRLEQTNDSVFSQKRLKLLQDEVGKRLSFSENAKINKNVVGYGVGIHHLSVDLIVNTPERQKEFREKIVDSPALRFRGSGMDELCTQVGTNDTLGIHLEPERSVYPCSTQTVKFILHNTRYVYDKTSEGMAYYGERYSLAYERDGKWYKLPINGNFVDLLTVVCPGEHTLTANLYPEVHPNRPGRYRYFKEVSVGEKREKVLLMAEFRLAGEDFPNLSGRLRE